MDQFDAVLRIDESVAIMKQATVNYVPPQPPPKPHPPPALLSYKLR